MATTTPGSTLDGVETRPGGRVGIWSRRVLLGALAVFVGAGLLGLLGVRTATTSSSFDGYTLTLEHATVARAGLDVPFAVTVTHDGGFAESITIAVTGNYFDIFETQGFNPEPSAQVRDADKLYLTFDAPEGDTFRFSYDAYIQPSSQQGRSGEVSLMTSTGYERITIPFRTRLLP
jgi:hypothetical protein